MALTERTGSTAAALSAIPKTLFNAKGEILVASAGDTPAVLVPGTNGYVLRADSSAPLGIKWDPEQSPGVGIPITLADAKGDLAVASANDTWIKVILGSQGQVLTVDTAQTAGVRWADPTGGGSGGTTSLALPYETTALTSYTFVAGDVYKKKGSLSSSATTFTVPPNSSVPFAVNSWIEVRQSGSGQLSVAQGAGVVIEAYGGVFALAGQGAGGRLHKVASDTWHFDGMTA